MKELTPISVNLVRSYREGKCSLKFLIVDCYGIRSIFLSLYNTMHRRKEIPPMEKLPVEHKQRLWDLINSTSSEKSTYDKIISCKCLYLIEQFINEKITQL
jgi:hypothetical protein